MMVVGLNGTMNGAILIRKSNVSWYASIKVLHRRLRNCHKTFTFNTPWNLPFLLAPNSSIDSNRPCSHWEIGGSAPTLARVFQKALWSVSRNLNTWTDVSICTCTSLWRWEKPLQCKFIQVDRRQIIALCLMGFSLV